MFRFYRFIHKVEDSSRFMINFIQNKRLRRNLSLLFSSLFALHFLLLHGGWSGFVLCIGNDGHIAVERSAGDASCSEADIRLYPETAAVHALDCIDLAKQHCGDCRDIALISNCQDEPARQPQKPVEVHPVQPLVIAAFLGEPRGIEHGHQKPTTSFPILPHYHLAALHSTVLLI